MTRLRLLPILKRLLFLAGLACIGCLALVAGCQSRLIYFPRPYPAGTTQQWSKDTGGKALTCQTSQGRQTAFLLGKRQRPERLWVVCGGNGTLALEWSEWLQAHSSPDDAWLLVDFPGYGECAGSPTPARIRESFRGLLPLAARECGLELPADTPRLRFFGHSLGAAAVLLAASDHGIRRGVLLAPFTSTMDMASRVTGLPLGALVWHRFDNQARLDDLTKLDGARVIVVHGTDDEVIPVTMGRALAARHPGTVTLREVPGGRHNSVQSDAPETLAGALREVRQDQ